jgi:hypothetical protein
VIGALLLVFLATGPEQWALPGFRAHLTVSERLDPDRLRALARPEVVLWLQTDSNLLKVSTREAVAQAGAVWVQVRPPFRAESLESFRGRVGAWVLEAGLDVARFRRWSPGRVAVELDGELSGAVLERVRALRPLAVRWRAPAWPDAETWSRAGRLAGLEIRGLDGAVPDCGAVPRRIRARLRVSLDRAQGESCGLPLRVEVPPEVEEGRLRALLVERPDAELAVEVGADTARADATRRLLDRLVAVTPGGGRVDATSARTQVKPDAGGR